ncbi:solute carrier family 46 member 2 [Aplochiton taeniatus]
MKWAWWFRSIEPLVMCAQLGSALFDTALQMVVKERCANATDGGNANATSTVHSRQTAMTDFYMTYYMVAKLAPILPALALARLGDRGWRKAPIVTPMVGYVLSRLTLLLVVLAGWPLEAMWGAAALHGLAGSFCSYWAGLMALVSLGSGEAERSKVMMRVELLYGIAGLVGSLASGHLFNLYSQTLGQGVIMVAISTLLYVLCLLYSVFVLKVSVKQPDRDESSAPLIEDSQASHCNVVNLALLFAGGILYDVAVGGAMEILVSFQMKEPLNWNATQVGYGNAAGFLIFLTSFLGVMVMSRCVSDVTLIIIGMLSFTAGIYFMAFVTETYMFYLARSLALFSLIPMPTIRSLLSQQVGKSSTGMTLISLQLSFKLASLAYTPVYTRIYQSTLDTFPGFVFTLSSIITVLATVPISVVGCRVAQRQDYQRIP